MIELETKLQAIYFMLDGEVNKYYITPDGTTLTKARELLEEEGIPFDDILRVIVERVKLNIPAHSLRDYIVSSERYYKTR